MKLSAHKKYIFYNRPKDVLRKVIFTNRWDAIFYEHTSRFEQALMTYLVGKDSVTIFRCVGVLNLGISTT